MGKRFGKYTLDAQDATSEEFNELSLMAIKEDGTDDGDERELKLSVFIASIRNMGIVGEMKQIAHNDIPDNWMKCEGQVLNTAEYPDLGAKLGTTYGGDGSTTFALPDLRGRVAVGSGQGTGLTNRVLGANGGLESVVLTENEMPEHTHTGGLQVGKEGKNSGATVVADGNYVGNSVTDEPYRTAVGVLGQNVNGLSIDNTGGGQAHENMMPFVSINYIICVQ